MVKLYLNDEDGNPKKTMIFPKDIWDQLCGKVETVNDYLQVAKVGSFCF